jgi:hypothetical protein
MKVQCLHHFKCVCEFSSNRPQITIGSQLQMLYHQNTKATEGSAELTKEQREASPWGTVDAMFFLVKLGVLCVPQGDFLRGILVVRLVSLSFRTPC